MWFWKKTADDNGECRDPMENPTSLPRILVDLGFIDENDVKRAYEFQKSNQDIMFGEALTRLDLVDSGVIDALLYVQEAMQSKDADVVKIIDYVNKQAEQVRSMHEGVQATYDLCFGGGEG